MWFGVHDVFLRRKKGLEVVVGEMESDEKELLAGFLRSTLKVNVELSGGRVSVDPGSLSLEELRKLVNKFVYHRNLNRKYWIKVESNAVKIGRFEKAKKPENRRREGTKPQTITHGW
jgi:hypothetical protein